MGVICGWAIKVRCSLTRSPGVSLLAEVRGKKRNRLVKRSIKAMAPQVHIITIMFVTRKILTQVGQEDIKVNRVLTDDNDPFCTKADCVNLLS